MASSATDAGNTEKAIRQKLIATGAVDCIVSVGNNFFYTRSLPCHVWFLDRGKRQQNRDKILMIDARNTFRKVTTTINDYSPGQLLTFSAIMNAYRGDKEAIKTAVQQLQAQTVAQAENLIEAVNTLRQQCAGSLFNNSALNFRAAQLELAQCLITPNETDYSACHALLQTFENPVPKLAGLLEGYKTQLETAKKALDKKDSAGKKQLDEQGKLLRELTVAITAYQNQYGKSQVGEPVHDYKQALKDWHHLLQYFPDGHYADVEGLCKIVDLAEVEENDYSLTPGRYVGYSVEVDEDFDYQKRIDEIKLELSELNSSASNLMQLIQGI
jgi:type I restriction enzyme M protein